MSNIPANFKFAESNEWVLVEGNTGTVGISDYAQNQLSDIVFAEIVVAEGDEIKKGDTIATIESVKAAADVYSPVSGKVIAINEDLSASPEIINSSPYESAWIIKIELSDPAELKPLMDAVAYGTHIESQG